MAAQLSRDFQPLREALPLAREQAPRQDPLVARVAELASLDPATARRAVEAVLETLAVRISQGEVEDLMERLPPDLIAPLERGLAESKGGTCMPPGSFLAPPARPQRNASRP